MYNIYSPVYLYILQRKSKKDMNYKLWVHPPIHPFIYPTTPPSLYLSMHPFIDLSDVICFFFFLLVLERKTLLSNCLYIIYPLNLFDKHKFLACVVTIASIWDILFKVIEPHEKIKGL